MSFTVAEIVNAVLDNLHDERSFDPTFLALLRGLGFYDIHFLHGKWEFGKDFIAKRLEEDEVFQYAFQTKGGDLDLAAWRGARQQVDELRRNVLGHPHFDKELRRRAVFVTTGRLVGGAPVEAQEYKRFLEEDLKELSFETWEREDIVDRLQEVPLLGATPPLALVKALVEVEEGRFRDGGVEQFSRRWVEEKYDERPWAAAVEGAILATALAQQGREDLAADVGLGLVRAAWFWAAGGKDVQSILEISNLARALFGVHAIAVWKHCGEEELDPATFMNKHRIPLGFVGYPVASLKLACSLSLLWLLMREERTLGNRPDGGIVETQPDVGATTEFEVSEYIRRFVAAHPGVSHPISDRYAVPLLQAVAAVADDREQASSILRAAARWTIDHYDDGIGLAPWGADEDAEVRYLLGGPFEHVADPKRDQSYVATVILDLSVHLGLGDLYEDLRADLETVGVVATALECPDTQAAYVREAPDLRVVPNVPYRPWSNESAWQPSPVHARAPETYLPIREGRPWDLLAVASLLRDRHFIGALARFDRSM